MANCNKLAPFILHWKEKISLIVSARQGLRTKKSKMVG